MEITLQHPYASDFRKGYLTTTLEGRKSVTLVRNDGFVTSVSYARYLMATKIGSYVSDAFEVDHKDNDRTNDDLANLQLLTPEQNRLKQLALVEENREYRGYECAFCGVSFLLPLTEVNKRIHCGTLYAFCGRSCAARLNKAINFSNSSDLISRIKELRAQGGTSYSISDALGISRNTVMKYW